MSVFSHILPVGSTKCCWALGTHGYKGLWGLQRAGGTVPDELQECSEAMQEHT